METMAMDAAKLAEATDLEAYRKAGGNPDSSTNQRICGDLVGREVHYCASMLVDHFARNQEALNGSDYSWEEVIELCEKRADNSDEISELEDEITEAEEELGDAEDDTNADRNPRQLAKLQAEVDRLTEKRDELQQEQDEPSEIYEHWIVSDYFARKLKAHGEVTGELFGITLWGRGCTGQAIKMDNVIQAIAAEMGILEGQRSEWKS